LKKEKRKRSDFEAPIIQEPQKEDEISPKDHTYLDFEARFGFPKNLFNSESSQSNFNQQPDKQSKLKATSTIRTEEELKGQASSTSKPFSYFFESIIL